MKLLVTGGAGFVGSHLCESLLMKNYKIICLDNFNDFYDPKIKENNIANALTNRNRWKRLAQSSNYEIHLIVPKYWESGCRVPKLFRQETLPKLMEKRTDKKIERLFQEYRRPRWRFDSAYAFAEWYNNRVHGALNLEYFETPNEAFIGKMRSENTLGMFIECCEKEVSL